MFETLILTAERRLSSRR